MTMAQTIRGIDQGDEARPMAVEIVSLVSLRQGARLRKRR
jgi:hypothetical protein